MCSRWFSLRLLLLLLLPVLLLPANAGELRVMSYNLWVGGVAGGEPISRSVAVIRAAQADIVGLQETHGGSPRTDRSLHIAEALGWYHFDQGSRTAIISRFPIGEPTPNKWGVRLHAPDGELALFNAHFPPAPYQPYQLLGIPYGKGRFIKTAEEAVAEATTARGKNLARLMQDIATIDTAGTNAIPMFVTGDLNEPSCLDWTARAVDAKRCPIAVDWPTTRAFANRGFIDGYRSAFPDPVGHPGLTWTPITKETDPRDRHDRIDFVFVKGLPVISARVVGEKESRADIVVAPYPSDHRAVVVTVRQKVLDVTKD